MARVAALILAVCVAAAVVHAQPADRRAPPSDRERYRPDASTPDNSSTVQPRYMMTRGIGESLLDINLSEVSYTINVDLPLSESARAAPLSADRDRSTAIAPVADDTAESRKNRTAAARSGDLLPADIRNLADQRARRVIDILESAGAKNISQSDWIFVPVYVKAGAATTETRPQPTPIAAALKPEEQLVSAAAPPPGQGGQASAAPSQPQPAPAGPQNPQHAGGAAAGTPDMYPADMMPSPSSGMHQNRAMMGYTFPSQYPFMGHRFSHHRHFQRGQIAADQNVQAENMFQSNAALTAPAEGMKLIGYTAVMTGRADLPTSELTLALDKLVAANVTINSVKYKADPLARRRAHREAVRNAVANAVAEADDTLDAAGEKRSRVANIRVLHVSHPMTPPAISLKQRATLPFIYSGQVKIRAYVMVVSEY